MLSLEWHGDPASLECPWCGTTDLQPWGVCVQSFTGETRHEIQLTDGQVYSGPRSGPKGGPVVLVHFKCLRCGTLWELRITGGQEGTRVGLTRWERP